jgi:hypothetical protein
MRNVAEWPSAHDGLQIIDVIDRVTSIEVTPDEIPFRVNGFGSTALQKPLAARRDATGARVTIEFFRPAPFSPNNCVRVYYDIAENGELREILGVPQLTHTTAHEGRGGLSYHYRLSHWIAAPSVMRFVPPYTALQVTWSRPLLRQRSPPIASSSAE